MSNRRVQHITVEESTNIQKVNYCDVNGNAFSENDPAIFSLSLFQ